MKNWGTERLNNLIKNTQLESGRTGIQNTDSQPNSLCSIFRESEQSRNIF